MQRSGAQQPDGGVRLARREVQPIQGDRPGVLRPGPPGGPGHHDTVAQGDPRPLGAVLAALGGRHVAVAERQMADETGGGVVQRVEQVGVALGECADDQLGHEILSEGGRRAPDRLGPPRNQGETGPVPARNGRRAERERGNGYVGTALASFPRLSSSRAGAERSPDHRRRATVFRQVRTAVRRAPHRPARLDTGARAPDNLRHDIAGVPGPTGAPVGSRPGTRLGTAARRRGARQAVPGHLPAAAGTGAHRPSARRTRRGHRRPGLPGPGRGRRAARGGQGVVVQHHGPQGVASVSYTHL